MEKTTSDTNILIEHALYLFDKNYNNGQPIRHLGISLGSLVDQKHQIKQISLLENVVTKKDILDDLNKNFDKPIFKYASELLK